MVIESNVYSWTFLKAIKSDGSFHVPEDCQHCLLYSLLELYLYQIFSMFPFHGQSFWLGLVVANPCLAHLSALFWLKHDSISIRITVFTWFAFLSHKTFDDRSLCKPGAFWFVVILNSLKINFFAR